MVADTWSSLHGGLGTALSRRPRLHCCDCLGLLHPPRDASTFFSFATFGLDEFSRQDARFSVLDSEVCRARAQSRADSRSASASPRKSFIASKAPHEPEQELEDLGCTLRHARDVR